MKVLHIINGMSDGGAETYIMNVFRTIAEKNITFDFLLRDKSQKSFYLNEISKLGGKVYYVPFFPTHAIKNYLETKRFLDEHEEYQVIEVHANALLYITPLLILRNSSRKVILHSHSTRTRFPVVKPIHYINKKVVSRLNIRKVACSKRAGKWMFTSEFKVVPNAISLRRFCDVKDARVYEESFVFVCVAKFLPVKNHKFILDIFNQFHRIEPNSRLLLIGDGPTKKQMEELAIEMGIFDCTEFCGSVNKPEKIMANATCFLLASHYEGIPLTLIEAQALHLHCVVSTNVDKESDITGLVDFVDLENKKEWLIKMHTAKKIDRKKIERRISEAGYNLDDNKALYHKLYSLERL